MRFVGFFLTATLATAGEFTVYVGDQYPRSIAAITSDAAGNTYVVGNRGPGNVPGPYIPAGAVMISGPVEPPLSGPNDVFVSKLYPTGNILFTDVFAGKGSDQALAVAVDPSGNIYVAGWTTSSDFPVSNALQRQTGENGSGFIVKLNPAGTEILYSTYFGGIQGLTIIHALTTDAAGNLYLTGETFGSDFPHSAGMPTATVNTSGPPPYTSAAFVTEISATGDKILFSGTIGGTQETCLGGILECEGIFTTGLAVSLDAAGNVYFGGNTDTPDLPTTTGALLQQGIGAFIGKISAGGKGLVYLTYLGSGSEELNSPTFVGTNLLSALTVDAAGNAYLAGSTGDPKFPATPGSFQPTFAGIPVGARGEPASTNAFIAKLKADGSAMVWATFLGGTGGDSGNSIAVDAAGNVWSSGTTASPTFPNAQGWSQGGDFLVEMNPSGNALVYSARYPSGTVSQALALDPTMLVHTAGLSGIVSAVAPGAPLMRSFGIQNVVGGTIAGRIAPAELISIYGPHIGPPTPITATPSNGFYPVKLGGLQVTIGGVAAPLLYVSDSQINAVVPMELTAQRASTIQIENATSTSPPFPLWVDPSSVNIFPGVVNQNGSLNAVTNPAKAGSVVLIYSTGWQNSFAPLTDGQVATQANNYCLEGCFATGGVTVLYAGAAPEIIAGVTQFNIKLNSSAPPGITSVPIYLFGASTIVWVTQ